MASQDMMVIIVMMMMMSSVFAVLAGGAWFFTRAEEGDECDPKKPDPSGNYVIDEDGKCVLDYCDPGYYKSGKKCIEDNSGDACEPTGTKDPNGTYLTTQTGECELSSCTTGYTKSGDSCELTNAGVSKYLKFSDYDFTGGDIGCYPSTEADVCESKCDADSTCVSYIHTANDKLCCIKYGTPNYTHLPDRQITGYIKNIDGYEIEAVGDRPAGDIENMNPGTLNTCKARCDELDECIGFNFNENNCWIKKAEGISPTYVVNGYQFYTKKL